MSILLRISLALFLTVALFPCNASVAANEGPSYKLSPSLQNEKDRCIAWAKSQKRVTSIDLALCLNEGYLRLQSRGDVDAEGFLLGAVDIVGNDIRERIDGMKNSPLIDQAMYIVPRASIAIRLLRQIYYKDDSFIADKYSSFVRLINSETIGLTDSELFTSLKHSTQLKNILNAYVETFPDIPNSYYLRGKFYYYVRQDINAKKDIEKALTLKLDEPVSLRQAHYMLDVLNDPLKATLVRRYGDDMRNVLKK